MFRTIFRSMFRFFLQNRQTVERILDRLKFQASFGNASHSLQALKNGRFCGRNAVRKFLWISL